MFSISIHLSAGASMASGVWGAASDVRASIVTRRARRHRTFIAGGYWYERINDDKLRRRTSIYTEDGITQLHSLFASDSGRVDKTFCDALSLLGLDKQKFWLSLSNIIFQSKYSFLKRHKRLLSKLKIQKGHLKRIFTSLLMIKVW